MPKAEKNLKLLKSNILNENLSWYKAGDKKAREIDPKIILKQYYI